MRIHVRTAKSNFNYWPKKTQEKRKTNSDKIFERKFETSWKIQTTLDALVIGLKVMGLVMVLVMVAKENFHRQVSNGAKNRTMTNQWEEQRLKEQRSLGKAAEL